MILHKGLACGDRYERELSPGSRPHDGGDDVEGCGWSADDERTIEGPEPLR